MGRARVRYANLCEDNSLLVTAHTPRKRHYDFKFGNFRFVRDSTFLKAGHQGYKRTFSPLIGCKRQCFTACTPYKSL